MAQATTSKHWHLTTEPNTDRGRGAAISTRKNADGMAKILRRSSSKPIYVEACTESRCTNR